MIGWDNATAIMGRTPENPNGMVVVIDDDQAVRESVAFLLEVAGYQTTTFASATEFLHAGLIRPTCLIVDHHMPQMTGLQLAERLHRQGLDIPFLLMSAVPTPEILASAAKFGVDRVLAKPFDEDDLLNFVEAHVETLGH